jgi:hypothetical protein
VPGVSDYEISLMRLAALRVASASVCYIHIFTRIRHGTKRKGVIHAIFTRIRHGTTQ